MNDFEIMSRLVDASHESRGMDYLVNPCICSVPASGGAGDYAGTDGDCETDTGADSSCRDDSGTCCHAGHSEIFGGQ